MNVTLANAVLLSPPRSTLSLFQQKLLLCMMTTHQPCVLHDVCLLTHAMHYSTPHEPTAMAKAEPEIEV